MILRIKGGGCTHLTRGPRAEEVIEDGPKMDRILHIKIESRLVTMVTSQINDLNDYQ